MAWTVEEMAIAREEVQQNIKAKAKENGRVRTSTEVARDKQSNISTDDNFIGTNDPTIRYENANSRRNNEDSNSNNGRTQRVLVTDGQLDRQAYNIDRRPGYPANGGETTAANVSTAKQSTLANGIAKVLAWKKQDPTQQEPGSGQEKKAPATTPVKKEEVKPYTDKDADSKLEDLKDIYISVSKGLDFAIQALTKGHEYEQIWELEDFEAEKLAKYQLKRAKKSKKAAAVTNAILDQYENIMIAGMVGPKTIRTFQRLKEQGVGLR